MSIQTMNAVPPRPNEEPYLGKPVVRLREGLGRRLPSLLDKINLPFLLLTIVLSINGYSADTLLVIEDGSLRKGTQLVTYVTIDSVCVKHKYHADDSIFSSCEKIGFISRMRTNKIIKTASEIEKNRFEAAGIMDGGYISIKANGKEVSCINGLTELLPSRAKSNLSKNDIAQLKRIKKIFKLSKRMTKQLRLLAKKNYCKNPIIEDKDWCSDK